MRIGGWHMAGTIVARLRSTRRLKPEELQSLRNGLARSLQAVYIYGFPDHRTAEVSRMAISAMAWGRRRLADDLGLARRSTPPQRGVLATPRDHELTCENVRQVNTLSEISLADALSTRSNRAYDSRRATGKKFLLPPQRHLIGALAPGEQSA